MDVQSNLPVGGGGAMAWSLGRAWGHLHCPLQGGQQPFSGEELFWAIPPPCSLSHFCVSALGYLVESQRDSERPLGLSVCLFFISQMKGLEY